MYQLLFLMIASPPFTKYQIKSPKENLIAFFIDFLVGGLSGAIAKTIAAPIERVKLLLQTQQTNTKLQGRQYTGIINCFSRVIKEDGFLALWRGNLSHVIKYFPTQAINFSLKDALYKYFCSYDPGKEPYKFFLGKLLSGGLAGSISLFFVYPLDFARTRLGVDLGRSPADRQFNGVVDCLKKIIKSDGLTGIYQGFSISILGIFFYMALYFGVYDTGKRLFFSCDESQISFWKRFLFAQLVTSCAETLSYPIDTIRRRLMMQAGRKEHVYSGAIDCSKKIYNEEGVTGFFQGSFSNICRSFGSSLVLVLYDEIQKIVKSAKLK